ncbi:hypothetical protein M2R47_06535 [Moraxella sp. Tifton1]|uniref:hypothetical protein n=1 Tax=Moraxella oculi TaxID=2940516 RepID=UPI0020115F0E|nr:hypothetical protein [Moraxella sp. Tifton1]MCL1623896.1 hypothetical protein [Moraxella sp. Tifton1]
MNNAIAPLLITCLLVGCNQPADTHPTKTDTQASKTHDNKHNLNLTQSISDDESHPITTPDGKIKINWSLIDTKVTPADLKNHTYPISIDAAAVKNYAKAYHISDKEAQHSIVVSMAAPEALGKLLDQLENHYLSHELTDGANIKLIIHTKDKVVADTHDYVFADKFAEGLVLPIEIKPSE